MSLLDCIDDIENYIASRKENNTFNSLFMFFNSNTKYQSYDNRVSEVDIERLLLEIKEKLVDISKSEAYFQIEEVLEKMQENLPEELQARPIFKMLMVKLETLSPRTQSSDSDLIEENADTLTTQTGLK